MSNCCTDSSSSSELTTIFPQSFLLTNRHSPLLEDVPQNLEDVVVEVVVSHVVVNVKVVVAVVVVVVVVSRVVVVALIMVMAVVVVVVVSVVDRVVVVRRVVVVVVDVERLEPIEGGGLLVLVKPIR
eukprot:16086162-Heterocapsa_arctica.AAC.1